MAKHMIENWKCFHVKLIFHLVSLFVIFQLSILFFKMCLILSHFKLTLVPFLKIFESNRKKTKLNLFKKQEI